MGAKLERAFRGSFCLILELPMESVWPALAATKTSQTLGQTKRGHENNFQSMQRRDGWRCCGQLMSEMMMKGGGGAQIGQPKGSANWQPTGATQSLPFGPNFCRKRAAP